MANAQRGDDVGVLSPDEAGKERAGQYKWREDVDGQHRIVPLRHAVRLRIKDAHIVDQAVQRQHQRPHHARRGGAIALGR